jgi:hypothetical protein
MVAANKQPTGSRPGPASAHTHGPVTGVPNKSAIGVGSPGTPMPAKGTPKPTGASKKNPLH